MACIDCTEFLVQGSGMVGGGTALSFERVVIAEDPDNIPLVLLSVKALSKDGVTLVDQTPSWLEATTSGQTILIDEKFIYRLTVTVEIDGEALILLGGAEGGEGTYLIELRAQVVDASKAVIVCQFNVCVSGTVVQGLPNMMVLYANVTNPAFEEGIKETCADLGTRFSVSDTGLSWRGLCNVKSLSLLAYTKFASGNNSELFSIGYDGSGNTLEVDITNASGTPVKHLVYDETNDLVFACKGGQIIKIDLPAWTDTVILSGATVSGNTVALDPVKEDVYFDDDSPMHVRRANYDGTGEVLIASQTAITDAGVTLAEIVGMYFRASEGASGTIYAVTDAGELFKVDVGTGAVTLLLADGDWDVLGNAGNKLYHILGDVEDETLYVNFALNSTDTFIYKVPFGDELNNIQCWQYGSITLNSGLGFDFIDIEGS